MPSERTGVEIFIRKVAPLGDPMELNVRGYELSIRKADAEMIELVLARRTERNIRSACFKL